MKFKKDLRKSPEEPQNTAFFMNDTIKKLGIDFSDPRRRLFADWEELGLGEIGMHTRPVELKHGTLSIECDNGSWAATFQFKKGEVIHLIKSKYPTLVVRTIRIWAKN
ncbi:MAG: DUF721 domain-containing protein [Sphaerochaetaceae bacterium]|jgi:predicted nucleic acid-binding Zn ribbon protein|nr:DUF721 domain-containing protein [Sphaerochaetaceae bacterium]NLY07715.1 DUF721 domain-containing protein [Spirochaetales bacterium]